MKDFLLYIWQLPQNLLGLLIVLLCKARRMTRHVQTKGKTYTYYKTDKLPTSVSLGKYILIVRLTDVTLLHEYGHQKQSLYLGWLYLPVVGLWSALRCQFGKYDNITYYQGYPEKWADRLGGVKVDKYGKRRA